MEEKINIQLTPFDAVHIGVFLSEMINAIEICEETELIRKAYDNYINSLAEQMTLDQFEDAKASMAVGELLNKIPKSENE